MRSDPDTHGKLKINIYVVIFAVVLLAAYLYVTRDYVPLECVPWPLSSPIPVWVCP